MNHYIRVKDYINNLEYRRDFADSFVLGPGLNIETPLTSRFFTEFGPYIKNLSLQKSKWREPQLRELLFHKLPNLEGLTIDCLVPKANEKGHYFQEEVPGDPEKMRVIPKLKSLNVNVQAWETSFDIHPSSAIKTFLVDLFIVSPSLERVSCPQAETNYHPLEFLFPLNPIHVNHFINGEVVDALDELNGMGFESNIRRVLFDTLMSGETRIPKLRKLSELDISMTLREEHIRKLILKCYPLKALDMIVTQNVALLTLHNFLSSLSRTLKHLKLRFLRRSSCTQDFPSGPQLKELEALTITGYKGTLDFVRHLSKLEKLIVIKIPTILALFANNHFDFEEPLQHVKTFEVFEEEVRGPVNFRVQFIPRIAHNFPNLQHLRLDNICDGTLRAIYTALPNIEVFIAKNGSFTDSGLTGIPLQFCKEHDGSRTKEAPSIAALKSK